MITAAGVGSGIDVESILSQLNELERQPVNVLNQKREALDVELSAYGKVKGALSAFKDSVTTLGSDLDFGGFVASSSDEEVLTATANGGNTAQSYDIEVLSLATYHGLASEAYESSNSTVQNGTLQFSSGDNQFDIVVADGSNSLTALRDAINDSQDNTSISASIINVDGGSRMVLTAKQAGTAGIIDVTRTSGNTDGGFNETTGARDASLIVHGFTITSSSNTITDAIEGITLNLTGIGKSTVNSERDTTSLRESVDEFVVKYNSMASTLTSLSNSDLQGDQLPRGIDSRMRAAFLGSVDLGNGDNTTALELGFTFDRYGTLSIDDSVFSDAVDTDVNRYVAAFADTDNGLASRFTELVNEYTEAGGVIDIRQDGVDTRKSNIDDQIDRLEYRLEKISTRLRAQFTAMDLVVTNLNNTSGYLASQLGNFNYST